DYLAVQKSSQRFARQSANSESDEYFDAESALLIGIDTWKESLSQRDDKIPASAVRRFAEGANPPLSPQALFALTRLFVTREFSDDVHDIFDFTVTKHFSKFNVSETRELPY